ncbi:unnamed protein product, partial [Meganyctiphanes norvegica]|uniref:C2H2-type domain-containing protein n=1 Tax=Meganyctiphanes norvegica TaxID=48144 RepID=A0AAV2SSQ6_MEGNR
MVDDYHIHSEFDYYDNNYTSSEKIIKSLFGINHSKFEHYSDDEFAESIRREFSYENYTKGNIRQLSNNYENEETREYTELLPASHWRAYLNSPRCAQESSYNYGENGEGLHHSYHVAPGVTISDDIFLKFNRECLYQTLNHLNRENINTNICEVPNEEQFECDICGYIFGSEENLKAHMKIHENVQHMLMQENNHLDIDRFNYPVEADDKNGKNRSQKIHYCDLCGRGFNFKSWLKRHMLVHSTEKTYNCPHCDKHFTRDSILKTHMDRVHPDETTYSCTQCDYICNSSDLLEMHTRAHKEEDKEKPETPPTGGSPNTFGDNQPSTPNIPSGNQDKLLKCNECDYSCNTTGSLNIHSKIHHSGEKLYSCNVCDKKFISSSGMYNHLKNHTEEKRFQCIQCQYSSKDKCSLKAHLLRVHTNKDLMECSICTIMCGTYEGLQQHMLEHIYEEPYKCDLCDFQTTKKRTFNIHQKGHTTDNKYDCEHCDKKFDQYSELERHMIKHTQEKPFTCSLCEYRTAYKSALKTHLLVKHMDIKPYTCDHCNLKFSIETNLVRHMLKHTQEKPFMCDECGYRCNQKAGLEKHNCSNHTQKKSTECDNGEKSNDSKTEDQINDSNIGSLASPASNADVQLEAMDVENE